MRVGEVCRDAGRSVVFVMFALAIAPDTAHAQLWSRHHASTCRPAWPWDAENYAIEAAGVTNVRVFGPLVVRCAPLDTSAQPDSLVTEVRVFVRDSSPTQGIEVFACRTLPDGGGVCGPKVATGAAFIGDAEIVLDVEDLEWQPDDFSYLDITIPWEDEVRGRSYVKGWTASQ